MTSYLNNGYDVHDFAKFEKFIPHSLIIPSFMTIGSQIPELDRGGDFLAPPYKIGSQNTPYKLGLIYQLLLGYCYHSKWSKSPKTPWTLYDLLDISKCISVSTYTGCPKNKKRPTFDLI